MLEEAMEVFRILLQEKGDSLITDAYIPKGGTYRLIVMNDYGWEIKEPIDIHFDKKDNLKEIGNINYKLIQELDYKSKLVSMNKPMDTAKKIHSNNYLSLAVKKQTIKEGILTEKIIVNYYNIFKNLMKKYRKKPKSKVLYEVVEEKLGTPDINLINKIEQFVLTHNIWQGIDLDGKDYAKIFFVYPDENKTRKLYEIENERYLTLHVYNKNDFNIKYNKQILGVPDNNMVMNDEKLYLKNKTRKIEMPYLLNQEEVLLQTKFFDYLFGQATQKKYHIYVDNINMEIFTCTNSERPQDILSGYYLRCGIGSKGGVEIYEADVITRYTSKLKKLFYFKNYIESTENILEKLGLSYDEAVDNKWEIFDLINIVFFDGKLRIYMFTDVKDIRIYDSVLKQTILNSRDILANWFWRGEQNQLAKIIDSLSLALIKNSILKQEIVKAQKQFNLRWSLLEYLNDKKIGVYMSNIRNQLREHINVAKDVEWEFVSDEEYSYAVGQAVSYLLHLSKFKNKLESYVNPFFNTRSSQSIKRRLLQMYKKYNYQIIHVNGGRNAQLLSHVMEYEPKEIKKELIMAGFTAPSLMYEKKMDD